ncbi:YkvI family membrane protein [Natronosalvus vescus]|uniref:YkvI family membrane protein n=1 Tax=Natronosalvus vescus TaxID=2953881 RepID=UPI0020914299|nr:hypothetical protein [Natronosalvus vescus]
MSRETVDQDEQGVTAILNDLLGSWFMSIVLPAIILQSVLIGGGYATGREIVEYGAQYGASGWIAVIGIWIGFSVMAVLTFELARVFGVYNYKSFIKELIWKAWPLFDLLFLAMAILIIAIMASAAGEIMEETLGVPYLAGIVAIIAVVGVLAYYGAWLIEEFKTIGSAGLYVAFILFAGIVIVSTWGDITSTFAASDTSYADDTSTGAVVQSGILYVGYNLAVFPAVFFALHRQTTRKETLTAGLLAGTLMSLPFALSYVAMMGFYPQESVMGAPVPWLPMLESVGGTTIIVLYGIVVGWTLIETSVGLIHAILDRIDADVEEVDAGPMEDVEGLSRIHRGALGVGILVGAMALSQFGIIALVAQGYTLMAYFFIALFAIPLLTVGVYRIFNPDWKVEFWTNA